MASIIDIAVAWAVAIAGDASHGYDQAKRWGPNYDCSSFVISAYEKAGLKVKKAGASNTRDMIAAFKKVGFKDVTSKVNLKTGSGLQKGDVIWRTGHVAMMAKTNYIVQASINENGGITGGQSGDQTGKEIYVKKWSTPSKPWTVCLRYMNSESVADDGIVAKSDVVISNEYLSANDMLTNAQYILNYLCARGWSKEAVCGMLGNMQVESTINPGIWENLTSGDSNAGFGLVQWTPAVNFIEWCAANNLNYRDIDAQLQRIIWEVENGEQYYPTSQYPGSFKEFMVSTASPETLAKAFMYNYERPASNSTEETRASYARNWFNILTLGQNVGEADDLEPANDRGRGRLSKLLFYYIGSEE